MAINFPDSPTTGQVYTSGSTSWVWDGDKWGLNTNIAVSNDSMPVGSIMWYANTSSTPLGWIAADGSAVSRTTYATLFATIGTTYGAGNGSTTFNVPSVASTTGKYYIRYTTALGTQTTTSLSTAPVGTMLDWPVTSSYPTGYLRADGSAVSRTSYADLFALLSTTYGSGDGSTTFNLPNMVSAGTGSPVKIIKASLGGIVEPSTVAHASSHTAGGSDVITITGNQIANYQTNRNKIINGGFDIWQRGTSIAATGGGATTFGSDRWAFGNNSTSAYTLSRQTNVPDNRFLYSARMTCNNTAIGLNGFVQFIEDVNVYQMRGQYASLSFWIRGNTSFSNASFSFATGTTANQNPGVGNALTGNVNVISSTVNITTSWQYVTITSAVTVPTNAAVGALYLPKPATFATNDWIEYTGIQLEIGSVATPFEFEPYETTLRKCMRYYQQVLGATSATTISGWGYCDSAGTAAAICAPLIVPMRIAPTLSLIGTPTVSDQLVNRNVTSFTSTRCTTTTWGGDPSYTGGTFNANRVCYLVTNSTAGLAVSAEL